MIGLVRRQNVSFSSQHNIYFDNRCVQMAKIFVNPFQMIFVLCSSVEETENLATGVSLSAFVMSKDAVGGCDDDVAELSRRENVGGPLLEVGDGYVVTG